jgi:hypothetical protein
MANYYSKIVLPVSAPESSAGRRKTLDIIHEGKHSMKDLKISKWGHTLPIKTHFQQPCNLKSF